MCTRALSALRVCALCAYALRACALRVCVHARVCACLRARVCATPPKHPPLLAHRSTLKGVEGRRRGQAVFLPRVGVGKSTTAADTSSNMCASALTRSPRYPCTPSTSLLPSSSPPAHILHTPRARATTRSTPNPARTSPYHRAPACTGKQRFDVFDSPKLRKGAFHTGPLLLRRL